MNTVLFLIIMVLLIVAQLVGKSQWFQRLLLRQTRKKRAGSNKPNQLEKDTQNGSTQKNKNLYWKDYHEADVKRTSISDKKQRPAAAPLYRTEDEGSRITFSSSLPLKEHKTELPHKTTALERINKLPPFKRAIIWSEILKRKEEDDKTSYSSL